MLRDVNRPTTIIYDSTNSINLEQNDDGIILFYDTTRNKTLSITRKNLSFGINHKNITGKRWLRLTSKINSNVHGYKVLRNSTITAISIQTQNNVINSRFNLRINGSASNLHTINLSGVSNIIEDNLNYDINKGDYIQIFLSVLSGNIDYPIVLIEYADR